MKTTNFTKSARTSPLSQAQSIKLGRESKGKRRGQDLAVLLPLTSLIDAFSIIVIYLLIGTQAGGIDKDLPKHLTLPMASSGQVIEQDSTTIRIEKGNYFVNDQQINANQLGAKLAEMKKIAQKDEMEILIQADQAMDYADLDPLLRAGSEAGIQKLKFAVIPEK